MGDYNVLIVSAKLKKKVERDDINSHLPWCDSAYHATAPFINMNEHNCLSLIVQTKWGHGIKEFLDWLQPNVAGGIGPSDIWAMEYSEYSSTPTIRQLTEIKDLND